MSDEEQFRVSARREPDRLILRLEGELDMLNAPLLESALEDEHAAGFGMIVLDLRQLGFIDSTGLRTIFSVRDQASRRGQRFAVTPGSEQVQRLLTITRLGEHLTTISTPEEMLA